MVRKQEVLNYMREYFRAPEVDLVDDSFDQYARHVCMGGKKIYLLPKQVFYVQTPEGQIPVEYYQCQVCGKLIINKNFI